MANKRNIRKSNKRNHKKFLIQKMLKCRRVAAAHNMTQSDENESSSSTVPTSILENIENNGQNDTYSYGHLTPTRPRSILENIERNDICNVGHLTPTRPTSILENIENNGQNDTYSYGHLTPTKTTKSKVNKQQKKVLKKSNNSKNQDENSYDAKERLIIDKMYFFEKLKIISNHAPQFGCNLSNLNITGETKIGLYSKLKFSCNMCNAKFIVNTSNPKPTENLDINTAAISGITNAGIGLEQFQGLCAAMNLPTITQQMYDKKHIDICEHWEKTAHESMAAAAQRERQAAIEEGRVKDGIPIIDVIVDGCWSKRSYKTNYAALSGAAAIIGRKFGEVIFFGVKNKYCCICARAQNKGVPPNQHTCFKNYTGSSSGMEAAILAEGFKHSIEMYNVIYGRVIADGDSSTYSRILEERPYKGITVEKIECRNHVLRNMCNKLVFVSKDTKYPLYMRKMLTTQRILAIRKVICLAIKKHKNDSAELGIRISKLYADISNSYNHAFGHHSECLDHYCCSEKKNVDQVPKIITSAFWAKIQYIVGIVATHSRSLIHDCDSNVVEQFNSIIAKFVGGKRTNLIQRQTYQSRCAAAVVAFNTKRPLYSLQKSLLGKSPKSKSKAFEDKRIQRNKSKINFKRPIKINFATKPTLVVAEDKNYGTDSCQKPDMEEDIYKLAKQSFLKNLEKTELERSQIERSTILQRDSSEWLELRRNLLTASNFGKIIKRRPTTSASIIKSLLYKSDISNVISIKHGVANEVIALNQLAAQEAVQINPCGLFIDSEIPFLGATPDGLIGDDTIVEIKCPLSAFKMPTKEAVERKKIKFWNMKDNTLVINKNDSWYYQVQGQLHITKRKLCLFAVWSGENHIMTTEKIFREDDFWEKKMVGKLTEFYMEHMLPELIDPRQTRNMPLRQSIVSKKRKYKEPDEAAPSKLAHRQSGEGNSYVRSSESPEFVTAGTFNIEQNILSLEEY